MSRYIDVIIVKGVLENNRLLQGNCEYTLWKQTVADIVRGMPSIDIVRCKECKHYRLNGITYQCMSHISAVKPDDYCSYGERRSDE